MIEYVYIINNDYVGFYYIPYAGSMPIHGTLECSPVELGEKAVIYSSQKECFKAIFIDWFGEEMYKSEYGN